MTLRVHCSTGLAVLLAGLIAVSPSGAQDSTTVALAQDDSGPLIVDTPIADIGQCYQFGTVEHTFRLTNRSDRTIQLRGARAEQTDGSAEFDDSTVLSGQVVAIRVSQPVGGRIGRARFAFVVETEDPTQPAMRLLLDTFVQSAYDREYPFIDFGVVNRADGAAGQLELASREVDRLEIIEIVSKSDFLEVHEAGRTGVASEQILLAVTLLPGAPIGLERTTIQLRTNVPQHPTYVVSVQAAVYGDIVPSEAMISLGAVRSGEPFEYAMRLSSRSGRAFRIAGVDDSRGRFVTRFTPCQGSERSAACWQIQTRADIREEGGVRGELRIRVEGEAEPIPLPYSGLVATADAEIDNLGAPGRGSATHRPGATEQRP